jgi:2,4-diaminopentanoate dehydrogenase
VTSVRVLLWGVGEIGTRAARMLLGRPDHTIIGAVSHQVGEDVGELVGLQPHGIRVVGSPEALAAVEADICLLATHQRVPDLAPQIEWLLERRIAVIAAGEEMIFPWASHPALADALDRRARAAGRQVYGTGVNPGFVMDALPLVLTSCCASVERIDVTRASDFSPYGPGPLRSLGVGLSPEEFERGLRDGSVDGHIGFRESAGLMARALGWEIDDYREEIKPIVAGVERPRSASRAASASRSARARSSIGSATVPPCTCSLTPDSIGSVSRRPTRPRCATRCAPRARSSRACFAWSRAPMPETGTTWPGRWSC